MKKLKKSVLVKFFLILSLGLVFFNCKKKKSNNDQTVTTQPVPVSDITIQGMDADEIVLTGTLIEEIETENVTLKIPYFGATVGVYPEVSFNSTHVLGLTATLPAGEITAAGNGFFILNISGTPDLAADAFFNITIAGITVKVEVPVQVLQRTVSTFYNFGATGCSPVSIIKSEGDFYVSCLSGKGIVKISGNGNSLVLIQVLSGLIPTAIYGLAMGEDGFLYASAPQYRVVFKINVNTGAYTIFAGAQGVSGNVDGLGNAARFNTPSEIEFDLEGNLIVADQGNRNVRKITPAGLVSTLIPAPTGTPAFGNGSLLNPSSVDITKSVYYVGDNLGISAFNPITQILSPFAGQNVAGDVDGIGLAAQFRGIYGVELNKAQTHLYLCDATAGKIKKILIRNRQVTTIAGTTNGTLIDGAATTARFNIPLGLWLDDDGTIYITDQNNKAIRMVKPVL